MFFDDNRQSLRTMYFDVWQKYLDNKPLQPLELQILDVIAMHPEYHAMLNQQQQYLDKDYLPEQGESNPFLHMGLHISIHEQVSLDRPKGIKEVYAKISRRLQDRHEAEHLMMECLAESIWAAQKYQVQPDEKQYLKALKKIAKKLT